MSSGRNLYDRYEKLLNFLVFIVRLLPKGVTKTLFELFRNTNFKFGVIVRYILLKGIAKSVGKCVYIGPYVIIKNYDKLSLGDNVSIHSFSYLDASGEIVIGNNVSIAHNCSMISFDHTYEKEDLPIKYNPTISSEINIEDDVWLGCGVRVLSGVTIYKRTICAAGCVVTKSFCNNVILGGVPAKIIKRINCN